MADRSFKLPDEGEKTMKGEDVADWQRRVKNLFKTHFDLVCPIKADGVYGPGTRSLSADLVYAMGLDPSVQMKHGVTVELRTKLRHNDLTPAQKQKKASPARKEFRAKLRKQWNAKPVHRPVSIIISDSWGYHPGVHDGVDVICNPKVPVYAMVRARVIDVRMEGWWSKAPSGDVTKGDGIVQLEVLDTVGPFRKGMHIGYGHTEQPNNKPVVSEGEIVQAGELIGVAGLANLWHVHLMANDGSTNRGTGNRDPRPLLDYAVKNG